MNNMLLLVSVALMLLTGCNSRVDDESFLGHWTAYSRGSQAVEGDMVVDQKHIDFSKIGRVEFEVESYDGQEYILKITNNYGDGNYLRIGPIRTAERSDHLEMEVAFYESKEMVLTRSAEPLDNVLSWGVYLRE